MALEAVSIRVRYGGVVAVADVSFVLEPGEIMGVIGPNGSGKTTLLNAVTGFARRAHGKVILDGDDVSNLRPEQLSRRGLRRTFQASRSFRWLTVADHIDIVGASLSGGRSTSLSSRTAELVDVLGLSGYLHSMPLDLPYGVQRNLGLLLAVIGAPRYLLLDEPTSGLHAQEADEASGIIRLLSEQGLGVMIIDHNMRFLRGLAKSIVALEMGQVVASGEANMVLDSDEVRRVYLGTAG
jgi:ABC-type branched-subunit amino acid transport system ATPase component